MESLCQKHQNPRSILFRKRLGSYSSPLCLLATDYSVLAHSIIFLVTLERGPGQERIHLIFFFSCCLFDIQSSISLESSHGKKGNYVIWLS